MSWLFPWSLAIGGAAALGAIALHFIARSRPRPEPLPTARFVPERSARARARSIALSDVALLLIRLAALVAIGVGVAGPVLAAGRARTTRIVVVDRSRDVGTIAEALDSARANVRAGDVVVAFDSAARVLAPSAFDTLTRTGARGSLSAALAAAVRIASTGKSVADSIELVVVSAFTDDEVDAATMRIRATWPGRIRLVAIAAPRAPATPSGVQTLAPSDDPVVAGLALAGALRSSGRVRLVRGRAAASDSAWARDSGGVVLHWPAGDIGAIWPPRATIDAIGGVVSPGGTVVGRFPRLWLLRVAREDRVVARWSDGEPAAIEHALGAGCIRDVGVLIDPASDLTLGEPFRQFAAALIAPCDGAIVAERLSAGDDGRPRGHGSARGGRPHA